MLSLEESCVILSKHRVLLRLEAASVGTTASPSMPDSDVSQPSSASFCLVVLLKIWIGKSCITAFRSLEYSWKEHLNNGVNLEIFWIEICLVDSYLGMR